jgi:hypothetical protein
VDEHRCPWPQRRLRDLRIAPDNVGGHDIVGDEPPTLRVQLASRTGVITVELCGVPVSDAIRGAERSDIRAARDRDAEARAR